VTLDLNRSKLQFVLLASANGDLHSSLHTLGVRANEGKITRFLGLVGWLLAIRQLPSRL